MKFNNLISRENRKIITPLSSAELSQRVVTVKQLFSSRFKQKVRHIFTIHWKKGKRKVQGVPRSQTATLPRPQEEEETDKSKQAQTEQTYEKH